MQICNVNVAWLGHASFRLEHDGKIIYIDPFRIPDGAEKADIIILTHEHFDHCSIEDIKKLLKEDTAIITIAECQSKLRGIDVEVKLVQPGSSINVKGIPIKAVPAYNINKFRSPGVPFHPKDDGKIGVVLTINGKNFYHAGDTDAIPEMRQLGKIDAAMVPVGGTYTMDAKEAAKAVDELIKPKIAIPMHYGAGIVGTQQDAEKFKQLVRSAEVRILGNE